MTIDTNMNPPERISTSYRYLLGILFFSVILLLTIAIAVGGPTNLDECIKRCDNAHKHKIVSGSAWLDCENNCLKRFKLNRR